MAGSSSSDVGMEDATTGLRLHPEAMAVQGVVLVVLDVNKDICMQALNWALGHVARKGDALRLVGVLSHVLNPMGYKCRLDENSWLGANRRILENELITKQHMLANVEDLDRCCERAGVTVTVEVKAGLHPKMIVVEEAKKHGAYHVVLDRNMKKDRKYFIDNLTCFVTRVRNSGGVDSVRSFAISKPLMPVVPSSNINSFRSISFAPQYAAAPGGGGLSNQSSFSSSLRGSSLSSTTYNQDTHEFLPQQLWKQDSMGSSGASRRSSCEELFSLNPESGPPPVSEPSTTVTEAAFDNSRKRTVAQHSQELWPKAPRPDVHDLTLSLHHSGSLPPDSFRALSLPDSSRSLSLPVSRALVTSRTNAFFSRSISAVSADRVASGRIGVREKASKSVWLWTSCKEVMTSALENGWTTFIFTADTKDLADDWTRVARIRPLLLEGDQFVDTQNRQVAALTNYSSGEPLDNLMGRVETVIVNGLESEVTVAERIVTAFQGCSTSLYAVANSASEAQLYVEALGKGTDGIVLQTEDPSQVYALKAYLRGRREATMGVRLVTATVTVVEPVGLGDRVCVDLCNLLHPGEGLLVGSFARALFLVHSEWSDIDQTSSRPFRVNAGPVHAYVGMAGGVTSYLSELHTGSQVMVVDAQGRTRTVLVGRVKIEQRPLLLVEVEVDGQRHSVLLQNTDSVCLVSPGDGMNGNAIPVTSLKRGHSLLLNMQDEEREIGIETPRRAVEK